MTECRNDTITTCVADMTGLRKNNGFDKPEIGSCKQSPPDKWKIGACYGTNELI